jgi:hypothetical protein
MWNLASIRLYLSPFKSEVLSYTDILVVTGELVPNPEVYGMKN